MPSAPIFAPKNILSKADFIKNYYSGKFQLLGQSLWKIFAYNGEPDNLSGKLLPPFGSLRTMVECQHSGNLRRLSGEGYKYTYYTNHTYYTRTFYDHAYLDSF